MGPARDLRRKFFNGHGQAHQRNVKMAVLQSVGNCSRAEDGSRPAEIDARGSRGHLPGKAWAQVVQDCGAHGRRIRHHGKGCARRVDWQNMGGADQVRMDGAERQRLHSAISTVCSRSSSSPTCAQPSPCAQNVCLPAKHDSSRTKMILQKLEIIKVSAARHSQHELWLYPKFESVSMTINTVTSLRRVLSL